MYLVRRTVRPAAVPARRRVRAPSPAPSAEAAVRCARSRTPCSAPSLRFVPVMPAAAQASIIKEPCPECKGRGRVNKSKRIVVSIPAGIDNGQILTMRGEGEAGLRGGPAGDLYISITVRSHKLFTRKGSDLYITMDVPMTVAALGGDIHVPTLSGTVKYHIPEGTQPGTTFRLREQGIVRLNTT